MAAPRFHLPLLLAFLLLSAAAAVSHPHPQHHGHGPHPHRTSPSTMTATARLDTAPSMHQNRMESASEETRQSLRVLNPVFNSVAAAQAPSAEDATAAIGAAADAGDTTARLDLPSPPPSLPAAGDIVSSSLAPPQPQAEEAGSSASEPAAPPRVVDEPYRDAASAPPPPPVVEEPLRDAASLPPPPPVDDEPYRDTESTPPPPPVVYEPYRDAARPPPPPPVADEPYRDAAIPPVPVNDDAARVVSSGTGDDIGLQQIAKVLASLGYNEMASSATLLADSTPVVTWPGAITVFGAPDVFLQHSCAECSRRRLILDHMALGYYPYAELAAAPARKLPSASVGLCLDVSAQPQRGPFSVHHGTVYVNGVVVSEPELYDNGRYVVHGLHGFIPPLSHSSCVDGAHAHTHHQVQLHHYRRHHHLGARSADTSAATAASVVRTMIREAISRLRDSGFGFVALAMRVKFPELEKLSNLTVFALDDQVIFTGGGHGYVSAVRFHIVPGHRLTRADLLRLRPGTLLPTLAGEEEKLVINLGVGLGSATDEVLINYIPVKEPDVVINSRVAVHGICLPFPRLHLAASVAVASNLPRRRSQGLHVSTRVGRPNAVVHSSPGRYGLSSAPAAAAGAAGLLLLGLAAIAVNRHRGERQRQEGERWQRRIFRRKPRKHRSMDPATCSNCGKKEKKFATSECRMRFCPSCVEKGYLVSHAADYRSMESFFCGSEHCELFPLEAPIMDPIHGKYCLIKDEQEDEETVTKRFLRLDQLQDREAPKTALITFLKSDDTVVVGAIWRSPQKQM